MYPAKRRTLRATIVTIFSDMTRDVSVFVKCDTIFRLLVWKLQQFRTSKLRKVVRQHTEGMVESIIWVLFLIYLAFQQRKKFENPLRIIDKVIAMSLVYYFLGYVSLHVLLWFNPLTTMILTAVFGNPGVI